MSAKKPHYFELAMRSYSDGKLNQEIIILREFANTAGELVLKQMTFTKGAAVTIVQAVIDNMDEQSMPLQEVGFNDMAAAFEEFGQKGAGQEQEQGQIKHER